MTSSCKPTLSHERLARQRVLSKAALFVVAASALPTVSAARDCWIDSFGRRHCRLSVGARIAIAVCIAAAFILLLIAIFLTRRRRIKRANQAFVHTQPHQQPYQAPYGNNQQQYQYGNTPYDPAYNNTAQYQGYPPAGQGYNTSYAPQANYTPPPGQPPEYQPPRSPPPAAGGKV